MNKNIGAICRITSGIYEKTNPLGEVFQLQARDFNDFLEIREDLKPNIFMSPNVEKHLLKGGDVLVVAKGNEFFAAVYKPVVVPAVASSVFLVLREINTDIIFPEYLTWFINQPSTQALLKNSASGSSLPSFNKKFLASLEIPVPPLELQQKLVSFQKLRQRERQLTQKLASAREAVIDQQLINLINT